MTGRRPCCMQRPQCALAADRRVGGDSAPTPHRPGRAELRHPVLRAGASLRTAYVRAVGDLLVRTMRNATSHRHFASAAIHCRFVHRWMWLCVLMPVSRQWSPCAAPPFPRSGPAKRGSPTSSVLRRRYDFLHRLPARLLGSLAGTTPTSCVRYRRSAPARPEAPRGPGPLFSRWSHHRHLVAWTIAGSPRFPGDPSRAFAQLQDPGRTNATWPSGRWRRCCPRGEDCEGSGDQSDFGAYHRASAPAVYASRAPIADAQARLASGRLAHAFTEWESNPLDRFERFQVTHMAFLLPRAYPGATSLRSG